MNLSYNDMPRCISPLSLRRNGATDVVPCGRCNFCLQAKRADWIFRIAQELKVSHTSHFITLTYGENFVPYDPLSGLPTLSKRDYQLFTKVLRKENKNVVDWPLRYYAVGEYGTQHCRPHYHALMFNLAPGLERKVAEVWNKGLVDVGKVEPASIAYVTKYVINRVGDYIGREKPFSFMSKRPGIGANYLETHTTYHRSGYDTTEPLSAREVNAMRTVANVNGQVSRLPRYYKDKMFTVEEKRDIANQSIADSDRVYWETIERLAQFHDDPQGYYDACVSHQHDLITKRLNDKNVL